MFAPFLEKIWAKVNGNYENIEGEGGDPTEGIAFLTNVPSKSYKLSAADGINSNPDNAWKIIKEADAKDYIITCATGAGSDKTQNVYGLANGHAYTLIGVNEIKDSSGNVLYQLYKIRNPWGGDGEYKGKFRDADPIWTQHPTYAQQVGFTSADDGIFFMEKADFIKGFDEFSVFYFEKEWKQTNVLLNNVDDKEKVFEFELSEKTDLYLDVDFWSSRMYPKGCQ